MSWEPDYGIFDITVETGKYRYLSTRDPRDPHDLTRFAIQAFRNGEPWTVGTNWMQDGRHSKSFQSLMTEFDTARRALRIIDSYPAIQHALNGLVGAERAVVERALSEAMQGT